MNLDHSNFTVNLLKRGKKPIKSSITAWNRSRKKEKKLPKYTTGLKRRSMLHFPLTGVSKTSVDVDGEEYFVNSEDTHVVFTRPKAYVESSGTTRANETERLRCIMLSKFEVPPDNNQPSHTKNFRETCARIRGGAEDS